MIQKRSPDGTCVARRARAWSAAVTTPPPGSPTPDDLARSTVASPTGAAVIPSPAALVPGRFHIAPGLRDMMFASFFFALMGVLVKEVDSRLPVQHAVFARSLIGLILSYALIRRAKLHWLGNRPKLLGLRGLFGFLALLCNFGSLSLMPLSDATVLHQTQPIWTTVFAAIFLAEPTNRRIWLATLVSLTGVVLVARPEFIFGAGATPALHWAGPVLALLAALMSACAYVSVRALRRTDDPLIVVFWFALVATPLSFPAVLADPVMPSAYDLLVLVGIGITVQIAQLLMTRALHREAAGRVTAVGYTQVVFAFAFGALFFGEALTLLSAAGALLVIVGAAIVSIRRTGATPVPPVRSA